MERHSEAGVPRVTTPTTATNSAQADLTPCRWCGEPIESPKRGQKFCCPNHRYLWHKHQRISPAKFEERVRAIVRDELSKVAGVRPYR